MNEQANNEMSWRFCTHSIKFVHVQHIKQFTFFEESSWWFHVLINKHVPARTIEFQSHIELVFELRATSSLYNMTLHTDLNSLHHSNTLHAVGVTCFITIYLCYCFVFVLGQN